MINDIFVFIIEQFYYSIPLFFVFLIFSRWKRQSVILPYLIWVLFPFFLIIPGGYLFELKHLLLNIFISRPDVSWQLPAIADLVEFTSQVEKIVPFEEKMNSDIGVFSPFILKIWVSGFIFISIYRTIQIMHIRKIVKGTLPIREVSILQVLNNVNINDSGKKNIRLLRSTSSPIPFTVGVIHPVIVLPDELIKSSSISMIEPVILHEIEHIKNRDVVWLSLYNLLTAVMFFNPFIWLARRNHYRFMEEFCDTKVLRNGKINSRQYGRSLLLVNQFTQGRFPNSIPAIRLKSSSIWRRISTIKGGKMTCAENKFMLTSTLIILFVSILLVSYDFAPTERTSVSISTSISDPDLAYASPMKEGFISSNFGKRIHPIKKVKMMHNGIDIAAKVGTPIYSVDDGDVVVSTEKGNYGQLIIIRHKNSVESRYAQLGSALVEAGDSVKKGQIIAKIGHSKYGTGPHLHFELLIKGEPVPPAKYIDLGLTIKK